MFRYSLTICLVLLAFIGHAQIGPGGPTPAPIDGGVSILLAGGAAYALKRLRRRK